MKWKMPTIHTTLHLVKHGVEEGTSYEGLQLVAIAVEAKATVAATTIVVRIMDTFEVD